MGKLEWCIGCEKCAAIRKLVRRGQLNLIPAAFPLVVDAYGLNIVILKKNLDNFIQTLSKLALKHSEAKKYRMMNKIQP